MNPFGSRRVRRTLKAENRAHPVALARIPREEWAPNPPPGIVEVWRSRFFLVQIYDAGNGIERISVNRTDIDGDRFADGITWDQLQKLKNQCGRGDRPGVELYPPDDKAVTAANMRHIWVLPEAPAFMWGADR